MAWCKECERLFVNGYALQQHLDNAEIHQPVYYCQPCNQPFSNDHALKQHSQTSIKHLRNTYDYVCPDGCYYGTNKESVLDEHRKTVHYWCKQHEQNFQNKNNLDQHFASRAHGANNMCPFCDKGFPTWHAVTLHMESGACEGGMNRLKVDRRVHQFDTPGIVTNQKLIGYKDSWQPEPDVWATDVAWNDTAAAFQCYFCDRCYSTLGRLNGHITQFHAEKRTNTLYHCPGNGCERQFKFFSQLMGHIESTQSCRVRQDVPMLRGNIGQRFLGM